MSARSLDSQDSLGALDPDGETYRRSSTIKNAFRFGSDDLATLPPLLMDAKVSRFRKSRRKQKRRSSESGPSSTLYSGFEQQRMSEFEWFERHMNDANLPFRSKKRTWNEEEKASATFPEEVLHPDDSTLRILRKHFQLHGILPFETNSVILNYGWMVLILIIGLLLVARMAYLTSVKTRNNFGSMTAFCWPLIIQIQMIYINHRARLFHRTFSAHHFSRDVILDREWIAKIYQCPPSEAEIAEKRRKVDQKFNYLLRSRRKFHLIMISVMFVFKALGTFSDDLPEDVADADPLGLMDFMSPTVYRLLTLIMTLLHTYPLGAYPWVLGSVCYHVNTQILHLQAERMNSDVALFMKIYQDRRVEENRARLAELKRFWTIGYLRHRELVKVELSLRGHTLFGYFVGCGATITWALGNFVYSLVHGLKQDQDSIVTVSLFAVIFFVIIAASHLISIMFQFTRNAVFHTLRGKAFIQVLHLVLTRPELRYCEEPAHNAGLVKRQLSHGSDIVERLPVGATHNTHIRIPAEEDNTSPARAHMPSLSSTQRLYQSPSSGSASSEPLKDNPIDGIELAVVPTDKRDRGDTAVTTTTHSSDISRSLISSSKVSGLDSKSLSATKVGEPRLGYTQLSRVFSYHHDRMPPTWSETSKIMFRLYRWSIILFLAMAVVGALRIFLHYPLCQDLVNHLQADDPPMDTCSDQSIALRFFESLFVVNLLLPMCFVAMFQQSLLFPEDFTLRMKVSAAAIVAVMFAGRLVHMVLTTSVLSLASLFLGHGSWFLTTCYLLGSIAWKYRSMSFAVNVALLLSSFCASVALFVFYLFPLYLRESKGNRAGILLFIAPFFDVFFRFLNLEAVVSLLRHSFISNRLIVFWAAMQVFLALSLRTFVYNADSLTNQAMAIISFAAVEVIARSSSAVRRGLVRITTARDLVRAIKVAAEHCVDPMRASLIAMAMMLETAAIVFSAAVAAVSRYWFGVEVKFGNLCVLLMLQFIAECISDMLSIRLELFYFQRNYLQHWATFRPLLGRLCVIAAIVGAAVATIPAMQIALSEASSETSSIVP